MGNRHSSPGGWWLLGQVAQERVEQEHEPRRKINTEDQGGSPGGTASISPNPKHSSLPTPHFTIHSPAIPVVSESRRHFSATLYSLLHNSGYVRAALLALPRS